MGRYAAKLPCAKDPPCHTLFVGHNPSLATWETGHFFASPSNRFWAIMEHSGLSGSDLAKNDDEMVENLGFGFCDVVEQPGNNAGTLSRKEMTAHQSEFLNRIEHYAKSMNGSLRRLCFVGKRQWKCLFTPVLTKAEHGVQSNLLRPKNWPAALEDLEVWVLPSTSGRAVISWEERMVPYIDLSKTIEAEQH